MTPAAARPRTLPRGLAPLVEALELEQAHLVTTGALEDLRLEVGLATPAKVLAARLRDRGWLLPTAQRGVYEFAPGAHAGALSRGDVTMPLQAVLHAQGHMAVGLTLHSAAWALGAADRAPTRLEVAAADDRSRQRLGRVLGERARVLPFSTRLAHEHRRGVPVLSADSVLAHAAARPGDVRSWESALDWVTELASEVTLERLTTELTDRPRSVGVRLSYLLSGLRPDLADELETAGAGSTSVADSKVYFGPRGPLRRHDAKRQVADTTLPFDPRTLPQVAT